MCIMQVFANPGNQMVLEYPLNELMKQVGGYQFMNICARKVVGERLVKKLVIYQNKNKNEDIRRRLQLSRMIPTVLLSQSSLQAVPCAHGNADLRSHQDLAASQCICESRLLS